MATFNLTITYPDGEGPRILAALKAHYTTQDENGNPVVPNNAEAIEAFRQSTMKALKDVVLRAEREAAVEAAKSSVTEINPS